MTQGTDTYSEGCDWSGKDLGRWLPDMVQKCATSSLEVSACFATLAESLGEIAADDALVDHCDGTFVAGYLAHANRVVLHAQFERMSTRIPARKAAWVRVLDALCEADFVSFPWLRRALRDQLVATRASLPDRSEI